MAGNQGIQWEIEAFKIGNKVKELREKNRYTLQDLAAKTGLSKEFLAEIENAEVVPPIANLLKLSKALEVGMSFFFQDQAGEEKIAITRRHERVRLEGLPSHLKGEVDYIYEALEEKKTNKHMEPFLVEFPILDTSELVFVSHEGEEFLHLLEGELEFCTVDQVEVLEPGDSIYFESDISHSFRCLSQVPAKAIVVVWSKT